MIESRSSTQFVHLQPATNGKISNRRVSLPDHSLSSTTPNCSPTYFEVGLSHRRASSDAAGVPSLACRAVKPVRFLERKGPKPFIQSPMSPAALQSCFTPLTPSIDSTIPEHEVKDPVFPELSHASRLSASSQDLNREGSSQMFIYREESTIKDWLSQNSPGIAHNFSLQSLDNIKDGGDMCLPLDRMSLALFDFASTPNRPRTPPRNNAPSPSERPGENRWRLVTRDSLSTLSISLDEFLIEEDDVIPSSTGYHENDSAPSKSSTSPLIQDLTFHKKSASIARPLSASRSPGWSEKPKYKSRLWDRKPKEMTLDLRLVSFKYLNTRSSSNEFHWWNSSETTSTDTESTRNDEKESFEREERSIPENAGNEYPFPRMNLIGQKQNEGFGPHVWITNDLSI